MYCPIGVSPGIWGLFSAMEVKYCIEVSCTGSQNSQSVARHSAGIVSVPIRFWHVMAAGLVLGVIIWPWNLTGFSNFRAHLLFLLSSLRFDKIVRQEQRWALDNPSARHQWIKSLEVSKTESKLAKWPWIWRSRSPIFNRCWKQW